MKYTPGPWTAAAGEAIGREILGVWSSDTKVVAICGDQKAPDEEESAANCYLIAAAPDYDSMARNLEKWWRLPDSKRTIESIEPIVRQALDAIAKAEGKDV